MNNPSDKATIFRNWLSLVATLFSAVVFAAILALIGLDFISGSPNPYLGIITYLILPSFLIAGLVLIVWGAVLERRRRRKADPVAVKPFPILDFNSAVQRNVFVVASAVATVFLIFTAFGSYKAYQFTESVTFCGITCHQVMEPEYTTYQHSPHARVACVQCHIGPGADWFVRSKLSGAYQIYSVLFNKYSRPINTPIKNMRPAQETCEQCHWPEQFFGAVENDHRYFLSDENNSPWQTRMLVLVGGGERKAGERRGIHWHMNIANDIYYIATDEERQVLPWVKKIGPDGKETIFVDKESGFSAKVPPKGEFRRMDCIDCHNRPSHNFKSPRDTVDRAMVRGDISTSLPYMKMKSLEVLSARYKTKEEGLKLIEENVRSFYAKKYPDVVLSQKDELDKAVGTLKKIYSTNFFPHMGVSWQVYPENIGHMTSPGCFRCHDGKHESPEGKVITNACASCHIFIAQGPPDMMETSVDGLPFKHPDPGTEGMWQEMACYDCHTGGPT